MTVIDGTTNNTTYGHKGCVGIDPQSVAVNPVTNKTYVANNGSIALAGGVILAQP